MPDRTIAGRLSIIRTSPGSGESVVKIELHDQAAGITFAAATVDLAAFAAAVTGLGHVPAGIEIRGLDRVGMILERKEVEVFRLSFEESRRGVEAAREALRPLETDGWTANDPAEMLNPHRRKGELVRVGFSRHVPREVGAGVA